MSAKLQGFAVGCLAFSGVCMLAGVSGARVNTTRSIPVGLYWVSDDPASKGSYVIFCPPPREVFDEARVRGYIGSGYCPGGYGYMMKKILAAKNDIISVDDAGVFINGKRQPMSSPLEVDGAKRPLPRYRVREHVLGDSELLLMSDVSATSFDARYFGVIGRENVQAVIHPVWTW